MIPQTQTRSFREFRLLAAGMIAAGAVWPLLPIHPPLLCPLRSATGIPCPFCGMTRSVVALLHGDVVASISISGSTLRLPQHRIEELLPVLLDAAAEVSYRLGWHDEVAASR